MAVGENDADGEVYLAPLFGQGGAGRAAVWPENLGAPEGGPEEASAWSLGPPAGAAEARSPGAAGSLAAFGVDAGVAASDLDRPAGTVGGHQAGGADTRVVVLVGPKQEAEGWERPSVQAGTPEAAAGWWVEGTAALAVAAASAAVVGIQELDPEREQGLLAEARSGDKPPSEEVRRSQMRLQVEQDAEELERSWE